MELSYSIEKLEKIYIEASNYYVEYKESIESLDIIINNMQTIWISEETQSYEQFKRMYIEKKDRLIQAALMMKKICDNLAIKINEFKEVTQKTINYFE